MVDVFIIDAVRTPRGTARGGRGSLVGCHPHHLTATVLKALVSRNGIVSSDIGDVIWSTSTQKGRQGGNIARMSALDAGYDVAVCGVTLDRFCGGGVTAIALAAGQIGAGYEDMLVAGGTEMMSLTAAISAQEQASGIPPMYLDADNSRLQESYPQSHQGVCADAIASIEGISRERLDALAAESQRRAAIAIAEGRFDKSLVPVRDENGNAVILASDEANRPSTTAQSLKALAPAFDRIADHPVDAVGTTYRDLIHRRYPDLVIDHVHHAGSSSGVVDGAAAVLLSSLAFAKSHGLQPRARIVTIATVGDDPTLMLNAPILAAKHALAKAGLSKDEIDIWEVNEAFAIVVEKFITDLDLDRRKVNPNGGAIALGHPIGATGAILVGTALDELERTGGRYALIAMCTAGGMAPAMIIERIDSQLVQ